MAFQNQNSNNANDKKKSLSFYITGTAGWNNMTEPVINDYRNYQYSLRIENPVFINPSNDPETEQMIQMVKNSKKMKQPTDQYPNPSIVVSLPAKKMDGTPQKPRYFDKASGMEVPVKKNIGTGQPVTVVAGAQLSDNSKYGFAIYLNGVIFDNVKTTKWYEQTAGNPLLAGFTPLSAQETLDTPATSETNVMFDQSTNNVPTGQNGMNSGMPVNNGMTGQMPNSNMNNGMGTMQNMQPTQPMAPIANGLNNPSAAWNQGQSKSAEVQFPEQSTNNDPTPNTNSAQDYFNHNA